MHRYLAITRPLGLAIAVAVAAAAAGCAANGGDESIIVLRNVVGMSVAMGGGCTLTAMPTEPSIVSGVLDATAETGYVFNAQLKSRITADVGQDDQRTVFTRGANVDIAFGSSTLLSAADIAALDAKNLLHFMAPFTQLLLPNGGLSDVGFVLVAPELATAIAAKPGFTSIQLETSFTVVGDLDGGNVTSQLFRYPVTIVANGLVTDNGSCASLSAAFMARVGNPCNAGQDFPVDCCTNAMGFRVCPAVGTGT